MDRRPDPGCNALPHNPRLAIVLLHLALLFTCRLAAAQPDDDQVYNVRLKGKTPGARTYIYPRDGDLATTPPLAYCDDVCDLKLPGGPYRLEIVPPEGSRYRRGVRVLGVTENAAYEVSARRRGTRRLGLALGITGPILVVAGISMIAPRGASTPPPGSPPSKDEPPWLLPVGLVALSSGAMLTIAGWHTFHIGREPRVAPVGAPKGVVASSRAVALRW